MVDINEFLQSSMRIFNVARKPTMAEFQTIAKVTGIGILLIAFIGFIVRIIMELILGL